MGDADQQPRLYLHSLQAVAESPNKAPRRHVSSIAAPVAGYKYLRGSRP